MSHPIIPPPLKPGAQIGIAAPAGPVRQQALESGMDYLRAKGFTLVPGEHLLDRVAYLAGNDRDRLDDLNNLLANPGLSAVWLARGGYGLARIIGGVDFSPLKENPKNLVGFSDGTVLFGAAYRAMKLATFYGPNVSDLGDGRSFDQASLWQALGTGGGALEHSLARAVVLRPGVGSGPLLGGCLSLLASQVGTPHEASLDDAVLFWEDVGEDPYRIDRMLAQLRLSGRLSRLRGMVVGTPVGCTARDPLDDLPLSDIVLSHLEGTDFPVVLDFPAGHCPGKVTLPLGRLAHLDTGAGRLSFPAVGPITRQ